MRLFKRKAVVRNQPRPLPPRLTLLLREAGWLLITVASFYMILVLASYSPLDPSWSNSPSDPTIRNYGGALGAWVADLLFYIFGLSSWWLVIFLLTVLMWGYRKLAEQSQHFTLLTAAALGGFSLVLMSSATLEALTLSHKVLKLPLTAGGMMGHFLANLLEHGLGAVGAGLLLTVSIAIGFSLFTGISWLDTMERVGKWAEQAVIKAWLAWRQRQQRKYQENQRVKPSVSPTDLPTSQHITQDALFSKNVYSADSTTISETPPIKAKKTALSPVREKPSTFSSHETTQPSLALLAPTPSQQEVVSAETINYTSRLIERKLSDFGVEVKVIAAYPGPVITRYEIEPAVGVKGTQIVNLMKDLARALSLVSIRVVETIPGKTYMGLELPNPKRQLVRLGEIIGSDVYQQMPSYLSIVLGKDIAGQPVAADLAKMPHLLVAGTTGSGKSVAINAIILSLLYKSDPTTVRLIMIDPKMLELSIYEGIPHLLAPVVTDMKQAGNALNWCVGEMERRYRLMSRLGVRNLVGYNQKLSDAKKMGEVLTNPFSLTPESPEPLDTLPLIVVIIDELADLMMVAGKKIEELIARLAQKARAAGIHLILATQRPSVDVITGLIKANIPTRIAFQVSSKIDSRTILDQMGAETLLGQGDMLYLPPGTGYPLRVHGAFVADEEVHKVVEFLKTTGEPNYVEGILSTEGALEAENGLTGDTEGSPSETDPLYDEAVAIVLRTRKASISSVQRHLRIGYNRAARLIEEMEAAGLVSAMEHNGNRTVLVPKRDE